jgi:lactate permease
LVQFLWSLPISVVAALVASGRVSSIGAGLGGTLCAIVVALAGAPVPFGPADAVLAIARGIWLGFLVGAVILGGLFFREIVSAPAADAAQPDAAQRRRRLFAACFLVGPFAEAATGFGVGRVAIVAMLQNLGLGTLHIVLFALFSQTLVPWGAMATGTMVGAALSGVPPVALGIHSALLTAPLLLAWLVAWWRLAAVAYAVLATPLLGAIFGFLAGSANAANGLLMPSQAALAGANHSGVVWVAALQNTAAAALSMLSPVRVAMGCALAGNPGLERAVYARAWHLGAIAVVLLTIAAGFLIGR